MDTFPNYANYQAILEHSTYVAEVRFLKPGIRYPGRPSFQFGLSNTDSSVAKCAWRFNPDAVMNAAQYYGKRDVRVQEVPLPEPGPGQALVSVERCGICGSDLHEYLIGNSHPSCMTVGDFPAHWAFYKGPKSFREMAAHIALRVRFCL